MFLPVSKISFCSKEGGDLPIITSKYTDNFSFELGVVHDDSAFCFPNQKLLSAVLLNDKVIVLILLKSKLISSGLERAYI